MLSKISTVILSAIIAFGIFGCSSVNSAYQSDSQLNRNWGRSFESARYNQILNPEAGNTDPVVGIQGSVAERIMKGYINSETQKQTSSTSSISGGSTIKQ
jgi:hypothetical protein